MLIKTLTNQDVIDTYIALMGKLRERGWDATDARRRDSLLRTMAKSGIDVASVVAFGNDVANGKCAECAYWYCEC